VRTRYQAEHFDRTLWDLRLATRLGSRLGVLIIEKALLTDDSEQPKRHARFPVVVGWRHRDGTGGPHAGH
jgi:hypothetical protein